MALRCVLFLRCGLLELYLKVEAVGLSSMGLKVVAVDMSSWLFSFAALASPSCSLELVEYWERRILLYVFSPFLEILFYFSAPFKSSWLCHLIQVNDALAPSLISTCCQPCELYNS